MKNVDAMRWVMEVDYHDLALNGITRDGLERLFANLAAAGIRAMFWSVAACGRAEYPSRILPQYDLEDVLSEIEKIKRKTEKKFKVSIEITREQYVQPARPTPADAPVVRALQKAVERVYRVRAFAGGVGAGTVAAYLRKRNFPAAVWSKNNMKAHQPDENCPVNNMIGNAKVFAHLFLQP